MPNSGQPGPNPSGIFKEKYAKRKRGHLSHIVFQPFGLGRRCLDCHDPASYLGETDPNGHNTTGRDVYFRNSGSGGRKRLNETGICTECHGGFYPVGSVAWNPEITGHDIDPNFDPNSVRLLKWGDPETVTCLQCHDDSIENGGIYASYISRYSSDDPKIINDQTHTHFYHDWHYEECRITAPDPDKVSRQNYWSKNGHGVIKDNFYAGITMDTGYPDPNKMIQGLPNSGAMNIMSDPNKSPESNSIRFYDLDINEEDKIGNFCWECHWSNETVMNKVCAESFNYPGGTPVGKYNGHLDTINYRDERWGDSNDISTAPHHQWQECRKCHKKKFSHFVYKINLRIRRIPVQNTTESHCIVCHNPHGSGDEDGNANLFMIKRRIYKEKCNNCHFSQFVIPQECTPFPLPDEYGSPYPELRDTWIVDFSDPMKQDVREKGSQVNSLDIPSATTDICEVCHQDKAISSWKRPYGLSNFQHRNGSGHFFVPEGPYPYSVIDYRGTDCTGCHMHDPDPVYDPMELSEDDKTNSQSVFNSKAFAPACRCHGIGIININGNGSAFPYDIEKYWGKGDPPDDIIGKGHGIPPPPFPDGDTSYDPHRAHARYGYPCLKCHIDPDGEAYDDPNSDYIFEINDDTPVGFDPFTNPNVPAGIYNPVNKTCSEVYCHSNGRTDDKQIFSFVVWSDSPDLCMDANDVNCRFCRDRNDINCLDTDGHFKYCDYCHKTPPDESGTDHSICSSMCDTCHPHNGIYEANPGFYKHVNGNVDVISELPETFDMTGCGCCHTYDPDSVDPNSYLYFHNPYPSVLPIEATFYSGSCHICHEKVPTEDVHMSSTFCEPDPEYSVDKKCLWCHQDDIDNPDIDLECNADKRWAHSVTGNCTICHDKICDPNMRYHYDYSKRTLHKDEEIPFSADKLTQSWSGDNSCGSCHNEASLSKNLSSLGYSYTEKTEIIKKFIRSRDLHNQIIRTSPNKKCSDCHGRHCSVLNIDTSDCKSCHTPSSDVKVTSKYPYCTTKYLHNSFNLGKECTHCHSGSHKELTYTEGVTKNGLQEKCKICHTPSSLNKACITCCKGLCNHKSTDYCLNCHKVYEQKDGKYKIKEGHYDPGDIYPTNVESMAESWGDTTKNLKDRNDCGVCHGEDQPNPFNPSRRLHANLTGISCNKCHGDHCDYTITSGWSGWTGGGNCGACHSNGDILLPGGGSLHQGLPPDSCSNCHTSHDRTTASLQGYLSDPGMCMYCHAPAPGVAGLEIKILCNGMERLGIHKPASNCRLCHPGVYEKPQHYLGAGPVNVIQSWIGPNSCGACHIDPPVIGCGGVPKSLHATLGPNSRCAQCHGAHCDMIYWDNPGKCIACHGPNPPICNICGPGTITSHYAFDSVGINQAQISNCLACHVEPVAGGEANPFQHIDNPPFVKEGACLGCHSLARVRHGPTNGTGCYACHPVHCTTNYGRNDACIWCHTANPPIVDICQAGLGVTTHMALDSSIFNQIQVTNCIGCHTEPVAGGEANPVNHINDPMTYVNPLTCLGCHSVVIPHGMSGLPWEAGLWPNVNCYSCHPKHCFSIYCNNQACIWCHSATPPLFNICGKPSAVPHTGDCLNCHTAGSLSGGECNPVEHKNSISYVKEEACLDCHSSIASSHLPGQETCLICHPAHCNTEFTLLDQNKNEISEPELKQGINRVFFALPLPNEMFTTFYILRHFANKGIFINIFAYNSDDLGEWIPSYWFIDQICGIDFIIKENFVYYIFRI